MTSPSLGSDGLASDIGDNGLLAQAMLALESVEATLRVATALAASGRRLDLTGLDKDVDRVCAMVLNLPRSIARNTRPRLLSILDETDRLAATMAAPSSDSVSR